MLIILLYI